VEGEVVRTEIISGWGRDESETVLNGCGKIVNSYFDSLDKKWYWLAELEIKEEDSE
jgi:hypothetical protein